MSGVKPAPRDLGAFVQLVRAPGRFFAGGRATSGLKGPLAMFVAAGLVSSAAGLMLNRPANALLAAVLFWVNAFGMTVIAAGIGYWVMSFCIGRRLSFGGFLGIHFCASAAAFSVAWIPAMLWPAEAWRWYLVAAGLINGAGLTRVQAFSIVLISLVVLSVLFVILWRLSAG